MRYAVLFTTFVVLLSGCSSKQLYQAGHGIQQSECILEAQSEPQMSDCRNKDTMPYEEYQQQRDEISKQQNKVN